jgi:hypothetical protein
MLGRGAADPLRSAARADLLHLARAVFGVILGMGPLCPLLAKAAAADAPTANRVGALETTIRSPAYWRPEYANRNADCFRRRVPRSFHARHAANGA